MAYNNSSDIVVEICLIPSDFEETSQNPNLPNSVNPTRITFAVINGLAASPTFVINLLIIWAVLENRNLRLNSYNILLACLAFSDVLVGFIVEPLVVWRLGCVLARNCQMKCLYMIAFIVAICCVTLTLSSLMIVSVERFLAIKYPIFHRTKVTSKRMVIALAISWITTQSVVFGVRSAMTSSNVNFKSVPVVVVVVQVVVIAYCATTVHIIGYRRRKAFRARVNARRSVAGESNQAQEQILRQKEYKRAFTASMLVLATFLCYCPFIITGIIETLKGKYVTQDFRYISDICVITFLSLQSLVNPLIVSFRNAAIRKNVKKKLCCCCIALQSNRGTIENHSRVIPVSRELREMTRPAPTYPQK